MLSCTPDHERSAQKYFTDQLNVYPDFRLKFQSVPEAPDPDYQLMGQLVADPDLGLLRADIVFVNRSDQQVVLETAHVTLETEGGNFCEPTDLTDPWGIGPGASDKKSLRFKPVNNRWLFMKTGLSGDLNHAYVLRINLPSGAVSTRFQLSSGDWETYNKQYGTETSLTLFSPHIDITRQQQYQSSQGRSGFVYADQNEISIAGANLQFGAYQLKDTLYLNVKIVNHGNDVIHLYPGQLNLVSDESPQVDTEPFLLKKSQRFIRSYQFLSPEAPDSFSLSKRFILIPSGQGETELLVRDIRFLRDSVNFQDRPGIRRFETVRLEAGAKFSLL